MLPLIGMLSTIVVISLCTFHPSAARTHHRLLKTTTPPAANKPDVKIPVEMKRDPADVALDRKIKRHLQRVLIIAVGARSVPLGGGGTSLLRS